MAKFLDDKTIYEIFRACRLCGAGGGYKMPILPTVVEFDCMDVELREKIRECVQIEVTEDDKMPPLICEICADKVNDFYEFLEMCRQTNQKTRQRLGLPLMQSQSNSEADNCILGVTETVYSRDEDDEPLSRPGAQLRVKREGKSNNSNKKDSDKVKSLRRELAQLIKLEDTDRESISSSSSRRSSKVRSSPTPVRETRQSAASEQDNMALSRLKESQKKNDSPKPRPKAKKAKDEDVSSVDGDNDIESWGQNRRTSDKEEKETQDAPNKRIKLTIKLPRREPSPPATRRPRPGPKCSKQDEQQTQHKKPGPKSSKRAQTPPKIVDSPPKSAKRSNSPSAKPNKDVSKCSVPSVPEHVCSVCASVFQTNQGLASHYRGSHLVKFTANELACNPCGEWFPTPEEVTAHHKQHKSKNKPYRCRGCRTNYKQLQAYNQHIAESECVPWTEVPDSKCEECWKLFPTRNLLQQHKCAGVDSRPGGKCNQCCRSYATLKGLKKHVCTSYKKKSNVVISPSVRSRLLPACVRISRCDSLLRNKKRCDASTVRPDFGLDPACTYPYRSLVRVKQEPLAFDGMVSIQQDVRDECYIEEDYVHWDSDNSSSDEEFSLVKPGEKRKRVPALSTLSLKTIFSKRCLGKVPRKLRKVKPDKFDSFFNADNDFDNVQDNINNIISNLGDDNESVGGMSDSVVGEGFSLVADNEVDDKLNHENLNGAADGVPNDDKKFDDKSEDENFNDGVVKVCIDNNTDTNDGSDSLLNKTTFDDKLNIEAVQNCMNENLNGAADEVPNDDKKFDDKSEDENFNDGVDKVSNDNDTDTNDGSDSLFNKMTVDDKLNIEAVQNGIEPEPTEGTDKLNGNVKSQTDLIDEIDDLYDKKLMDELDAQIGESSDRSDKITLDDLITDNL